MNNTGTIVRRDYVSLFTERQYKQLLENGNKEYADPIPVAYLVQSELKYQWLVCELYSDKPNVAYGLYYLNDGKPRTGHFDLDFIYNLNATKNKVFNQPAFHTEDTLALFKAVAEECGYIVPREEFSGALFEKYRKLIY